MKKQRSTGDLDRKGVTSIRSTGSTTSWMSSESGFTTGGASMMSEGSNQSFALEVCFDFFSEFSTLIPKFELSFPFQYISKFHSHFDTFGFDIGKLHLQNVLSTKDMF